METQYKPILMSTQQAGKRNIGSHFGFTLNPKEANRDNHRIVSIPFYSCKSEVIAGDGSK